MPMMSYCAATFGATMAISHDSGLPAPPGPPGLVKRMPLRCAVSVAFTRLMDTLTVGPAPGYAQSRGAVTVAHSGTGPPRSGEYQ